MVKARSPLTGVCSSITTRPRRILRSPSGASLDVQGSIVAKNVWLFENEAYQETCSEELCVDSIEGSHGRGHSGGGCRHTWLLATNLQSAQLCAKCNKKIGTRRAINKCTACKGVYHLKCSAKLDEKSAADENRAPKKMDVTDFVPSERRKPAKHVPCQVTKSKKRVPFSRLPNNNKENRPSEINNNEESTVEPIEDLDCDSVVRPDPANETGVSTRSQTKQKLAGMKSSFVKRCQSFKNKVKCLKEKVGQSEGTSSSSSTSQTQSEDKTESLDTPAEGQNNSAEEERMARVTSPVLNRVRSRQAEIRAQSIRRRARPYNRDSKRRQQIFVDVDLCDIRERLDLLERKLNTLERDIPAEVREWQQLRLKFRNDYKGPASMQNKSSLDQDTKSSSHATHPKELEAGLFPSLSSATSDEVYVVHNHNATISSHEDTGHMIKPECHMTETSHVTVGNDQSDSSLLPSGIPNRLKLDIKGENTESLTEHQTSTPVTNCELSFRSASKQYAKLHKITHKNITSINVSNSMSDESSFRFQGGNPINVEGEITGSSKTSSERDQRRVLSPEQSQRKVLSPEQIAVKSFLEKRKSSSGSFCISPNRQSSLSASPPVASSTFRNGFPGGSPQPGVSPVSFTTRHDVTGGSNLSYAKILEESRTGDTRFHSEDPNSPVMSELSCTFRNDSQMFAMRTDENLPGYTTNCFAAQTYATTESESEVEGYPRGNRIRVEADVEIDGEASNVDTDTDNIDGVVNDARFARQEIDCAASADGTTLTNVTEFSADEVNSFSDKKEEHARSRWINKDVFMFNCNGVRKRDNETQGLGMSHKVRGDKHVDATGDGRKPPVPGRKSPVKERVDFLREAEKHLEIYKSRSQHDVSARVSLENLRRSLSLETQDTAAGRDTAFQERNIISDVVKDRALDVHTDETSEFEEMERHFQNESISQGLGLSKSLTDIHRGSPNSCNIGRSASCTNSIDGDTRSMINENARYHFLHEKGMIKISSPGLKIVSSSPTKKRAREITDIKEEEENSDAVKSGSESDLNEFIIDNKFSLISNSDILSSRSETSNQVSSSVSRTQLLHEAELLDGYLKTVDQNQATWDNVLSWMERDCGEPGVDELQEELQRMMEHPAVSAECPTIPCNSPEGSARPVEDRIINGAIGQRSDSPVEDSVYYSFHGQSEELKYLLSSVQTQQDSDKQSNHHEEDEEEEARTEELDEDDGEIFSNLMETILHGSLRQVEKFLNSDRTISEMEIKDATTWALEQRNYEISRLLLQDICRLLVAAEGENCVDAFPAYRKGHHWEPLFVVLSKQNFQGEWDTFMGFSVYRRRYDFVSPEAALVINSDLVRDNPLSIEDFTSFKKAISTTDLHQHHSNVTVVNACPYRSRRGGEVLEKGLCIVIHCLLKGFIPYEEEAFPQEIAGIPVDVREGYFQLGVRTPPRRRRVAPPQPQPWDDSASMSDDTSSQVSQSAGSVCRTGSHSSDSAQSMSHSQASSSGSASSLAAFLPGDGSKTLVPYQGVTDTEGDVVMGPSGDILDKVQAMDIDGTPALHVGTKSKDFNQPLLMGTCIGPVGGEGSGTLGGFVTMRDGRQAALTCAHVTGGQKMMCQPAEAELESEKAAKRSRRCVFGQVCEEVFHPGSIDETGVDAAAVVVHDRFPDDALFIWARKEQLKFAGFNPKSPPKFTKGQILCHDDITPKKRHTSVLKIGAETGLTSGKLYLDGLYARTSNREMRLPGSQRMIEFFNQMEIASVTGMSTRFFDLGDSGALVFMPLNGSELFCIGQCVGCTSYGSCVVTPIEDVFNKLKISNFKDFTKHQA